MKAHTFDMTLNLSACRKMARHFESETLIIITLYVKTRHLSPIRQIIVPPLHLPKKKDGIWRHCEDHQILNALTQVDVCHTSPS
ncbi:hypothetical protein CEXT_619501 [Caerostris extrusa]|uniref:Uncharacterized protein n=1 Tax=Caerostris extrusa TaxID=172846 RepID=A0AAV4N7Y8_CAEEX|nr:hypothetical protein CEXT_619501 [Caerostris extrusa]